MVYSNDTHFTCYSPRVKENLGELGYAYIGYPDKDCTFLHLSTKKRAFVYRRDCRMNNYLARCKENKDNNLGLTDREIIEEFQETY